MKYVSIMLISFVFFSGCASTDSNVKTRVTFHTESECSNADRTDRAKFILKCMETTSTVEAMRECQSIAEKTLCDHVKYKVTDQCYGVNGCVWAETGRELVK